MYFWVDLNLILKAGAAPFYLLMTLKDEATSACFISSLTQSGFSLKLTSNVFWNCFYFPIKLILLWSVGNDWHCGNQYSLWRKQQCYSLTTYSGFNCNKCFYSCGYGFTCCIQDPLVHRFFVFVNMVFPPSFSKQNPIHISTVLKKSSTKWNQEHVKPTGSDITLKSCWSIRPGWNGALIVP